MPVMLANCSYSLELGKETQLQYNWETLEKRIIDRFIRGRPLVDFEVDVIVVLHTLYRLFVCLFVCLFTYVLPVCCCCCFLFICVFVVFLLSLPL